MNRTLVIQLVDALEKLSDTEQTYAALDKADVAIAAAREYLATEPSGERAELIERLRDYEEYDNNKQAMSDAADMLETDAQQRSKPHGHCMHIKCREIWVAYLGSIQKLSKYEPGATMHLNKEP